MLKETRLTPDNHGHFFFGFHDLVAWNTKGNRIAVLRIDNILAPPDGNMPCDVGFIEEGTFVKLGETMAYNYPQGARQQWIGTSNLLIVNDKVGDFWGSKVYDTDLRKLLYSLSFSTHVITDKGWAFGLDYARLHRVGGYGYTGLEDVTKHQNAPENSGIVKHNIYNGENQLLLSIKEVANFEMEEKKGKYHYITHLLLSPNQERVAFLHRFKLSDGGETTRLMTIGTDGQNLRCLASGFLSHFDWRDDNSIAIWGRIDTNVEKLRNSMIYQILPTSFLVTAKAIVKRLYYSKRAKSVTKNTFNWMVFSDTTPSQFSIMGEGILTEDGHPMFCPINRDWLICDTYPNVEGVRILYLFNHKTNTRIDLGKYKMINTRPDLENIKEALQDVEPSVLRSFKIENMAFYRSGLHCDLHPRWKKDGKMVAFDSIHEGRRLIYGMDVEQYIHRKQG